MILQKFPPLPVSKLLTSPLATSIAVFLYSCIFLATKSGSPSALTLKIFSANQSNKAALVLKEYTSAQIFKRAKLFFVACAK